MPLTHEDLAKLKAPFAVEDHEFHRELVYLTEEAITNRLDEVDPSWYPLIVDKGYRPTADGSLSFWCHMRITVNGVSRDGIGMSDIVLTKSGKEANEAEKSAATDALKRAARMFGVGRYLLGGKGVKNENDLRRWLGLPPQSTQRNNPPQQQKPDAQRANEKQVNLTSVTVKESKGKKFLHFTTSDGASVTAWSRQPFIDGFWITENEWTQGTTQIDPPIPATLTATPDGKYWNISSIETMPDPFADDDPLEEAFPRKGKTA